MPTATPVLVAGAGPTGLLLALELCRHGLRPRVVDAAPGPSPLSRALVVHARTLELLDRHGLAGAFVARGEVLRAAGLRMHGRLRAVAPVGSIGTGLSPFPFLLTLSQDQTELLLREALAGYGVSVEWGTRLLGLSAAADGVTVQLQQEGGAVETAAAGYVAGCDGAHSAVRHALGVGFPGGTYEQVFFVADTVTEGLDAPEGARLLQISLDERQFSAFFPMPQGRTRIIGLLPPGVAPAEASFERLRPGLEQLERIRVCEVTWFSTYKVHHRVADAFRHGRVLLLGDAAHVHSPAGGQGMNTGLGDAVNLGWKLAAAARGQAPDRLLDTYAAERMPFARQLVATTDRAFTGATSGSVWAGWVRTTLVPRVLPWLLRVPALRRLLFRTLSQTGIQYLDSPLSQGRAGRVRGGERLPWAAESRYEPLRQPGWQLLGLGEPPAALRAWAARQRLPLTVVAASREEAAGALYLVRPDGYLGLVAPQFDEAQFSAYAAEWGVQGAAAAGGSQP
ncbi:FAD-dependent monooxygenase [Hymenobacter sp. 15J16-1T3B]|uniref:FAD-dependent monooxygenase n=1 Tax=Hymenobacter sp. 15J16-1T3B TaxID=2886941 RepID=UPI001D0FE67A|nr:FAD-dependent monooxygenase [Hymenobacter sp. 15J16-1T3B]MCC3156786.1 FAD-dependent monooxygenase [Hymenobacter sp. 15J16-1T3B]